MQYYFQNIYTHTKADIFYNVYEKIITTKDVKLDISTKLKPIVKYWNKSVIFKFFKCFGINFFWEMSDTF